MNKRLVFIPVLLLTLVLWVGAAAAQTPLTAVLIAPEGPFTVGDPVEIQLAVTHPPGYHVIQPELPEAWGDLHVHSLSPAETVALDDGSEMTVIVIDTRLFAPGEFNTPSLEVSVTDGAGQLMEVTAEPVPISVASVLVQGDSDLRDIKPQAELPFFNIIPWVASGLLLAAVMGAAYLMWKRRQARLALANVDHRLPHEIALDDLTRIGQLGLPEQGRFKEHYTLVSDTVRIYIERTQDVPMLERTTEEIRAGLRSSGLSRENTRSLIAFLEECDWVKFSEYIPGEAEAYEIITQARQIVEETRPIVITEADLDDNFQANNGSKGHSFSANGKVTNVEVSR